MRFAIATTLLLTFAGATASAQASTEPKWGPAPAVFPAGAQMAVMQGNPGKPEMFTVRLKFPDGYAIAPHWHPTDEHLKVISGTFKVGMGKKVEAAKMHTLNVGDSATAPAKEPHYAKALGATVVQVNAMGPFAMTYVNPADTPKAAVAKK
jgi:quercetin dioxygenase-like cupin family protein